MHGSLKALLGLSTALVSVPLLSVAARAEVPSQFVNAQTGTTYTFTQQDCSKMVTFSNTSAVAVTLPQAGTAGKFFAGCFIDVENKGAGVVTITPTTSTINGQTTLVLNRNQGSHIDSDSTNYQLQPGTGVGGGAAPCAGSTSNSTACNGSRGVETMTVSAAGLTQQTIAFTNSFAATTSVLLCGIAGYTGTYGIGTAGTAGTPALISCAPSAGIITAIIENLGTLALSGVVTLDFGILN